MAIETLRPTVSSQFNGFDNWYYDVWACYAGDNDPLLGDYWLAIGDNYPGIGGSGQGSVGTFQTRTQTWSSALFYYKILGTKNGEQNNAFWDVSASSNGTSIGTIIADGTLRSISITQSQFDAGITVDLSVEGRAGSDPDFDPYGGTAQVDVYEVYVEGTYASAPIVTNLNGGANYCSIGQTVDISGSNFTGATSVSIAGTSASFSVTSSTTISVTIPQLGSGGYGSGKSVSVTTPNGTDTQNVGYINTPTLSAISPAITMITEGESQTFSSTISNITPTTPHWYASSGTIGQTTGAWTAPNPPLANGYSSSITVWPEANASFGTPVASLSVAVYYAPEATGILASNASPAYGDTFTLTPTYSNGTGAITYPGGSITCPASGSPTSAITANWSGTRRYTLTVTNTPGTTATTFVDVTPQTVSLTGIYGITDGGTYSINEVVSNLYCTLTGGITNLVNWTTSPANRMSYSQTSSNGYNSWTAPSTAGTYTITATSNDDASQTITFTIYVVAVPVISSFTASSDHITIGDSVNLYPVFANPNPGYQHIGTTLYGSEVSSNPTSGGTYSVSPPSTSTHYYYLEVVGADAARAASSLSVNVYAVPVATSLVPTWSGYPTAPLYGATITLTPTFSDSASSYLGSQGNQSSNISYAVGSGVGYNTTITATTTYTLSISNVAGRWVYLSTSAITPQTVSVAAISPATPTIQGNSTGNQFTSSVSGAANAAITWTFKVGVNNVGIITAGQGTNTVTWTAPTNSQTVTVKALSQADSTTNQTTTITVTQAPLIYHATVSSLGR